MHQARAAGEAWGCWGHRLPGNPGRICQVQREGGSQPHPVLPGLSLLLPCLPLPGWTGQRAIRSWGQQASVGLPGGARPPGLRGEEQADWRPGHQLQVPQGFLGGPQKVKPHELGQLGCQAGEGAQADPRDQLWAERCLDLLQGGREDRVGLSSPRVPATSSHTQKSRGRAMARPGRPSRCRRRRQQGTAELGGCGQARPPPALMLLWTGRGWRAVEGE